MGDRSFQRDQQQPLHVGWDLAAPDDGQPQFQQQREQQIARERSEVVEAGECHQCIGIIWDMLAGGQRPDHRDAMNAPAVCRRALDGQHGIRQMRSKFGD